MSELPRLAPIDVARLLELQTVKRRFGDGDGSRVGVGSAWSKHLTQDAARIQLFFLGNHMYRFMNNMYDFQPF